MRVWSQLRLLGLGVLWSYKSKYLNRISISTHCIMCEESVETIWV